MNVIRKLSLLLIKGFNLFECIPKIYKSMMGKSLLISFIGVGLVCFLSIEIYLKLIVIAFFVAFAVINIISLYKSSKDKNYIKVNGIVISKDKSHLKLEQVMNVVDVDNENKTYIFILPTKQCKSVKINGRYSFYVTKNTSLDNIITNVIAIDTSTV